jgi:glutamine synthetase
MASKQILPAVVKYTKVLADTVVAINGAGADASVQVELLNEVTVLLKQAKEALNHLKAVAEEAMAMSNGKEKAFFYMESVRSAMDALRAPVDGLEQIVDKDMWPIPTYAELIFEV